MRYAQHVLRLLLRQTDCYSKVDIVLEGGLPVLIEMMHSADVETAHQGTGVVANLAEVVENQGKMVESGELLRQSSLHVLHHYAHYRCHEHERQEPGRDDVKIDLNSTVARDPRCVGRCG